MLLIFCAALGFPLALILAWIFDITDDGVERTKVLERTADDEGLLSSDVLTVTTSADERPGIVVLPFQYYSDQPLDEIVSNGFTEDLTTLLARVPGFFVISRNTAFTYKNQMKDLREIGSELGVRYLLEGSMRRIGEQVRVTAQLIDAESGSHLWAEHYDTPGDRLDQVQDALIGGIAMRLGVELARAEFKLASRKPPSDRDAWSLYQSAKGTLMFNGWSEDSIKKARAQLRQAIELDPLSTNHRRNLAAKLMFARSYGEAISETETLLELEPDNADALYFKGISLGLNGELEAGVYDLQRAIEINPEDPYYAPALAYLHAASGQREQAIAILESSGTAGTPEMPLKEIAIVYGELAELDLAFEYLDRAYETERGSLFYLDADPSADALRSDPRFDAFLAKLAAE